MADVPVTPNLNLIISVDRLRQLCGIDDTLDAEYVAPHVEIATDVIAAPVLGTKLINKLILDFNNNNLTGVYAELYPLVEKMVIFQAFKYMLPELWIKISSGKVSKGNTADSQPVEASEIALLERRQAAKVVTYQNQVEAFLSGNSASIPELNTNDSKKGDISPEGDTANGAQGMTSTPNITFNFREF